MKYILDSNIITFLIDERYKDRKEAIDRRIREALVLGNDIVINAFSYYEIKRGLLDVKSDRKTELFDQICKTFEIALYNDLEIFEEASRIWASMKKKGKPVGDADILIGALAKVKNATLVTDNEKHFRLINDLVIENFSKT